MDWTTIKKIFHEIFSEPGPAGTLSWGRVASTIALVSVICWVTYTLILTGHLPGLEGVTGFVTAPYLSNKITTAAQSFGPKGLDK